MAELRFGPDGYLDVSSLPDGDPDAVLSPDELARLHETLTAVGTDIDDERWDGFVHAAVTGETDLDVLDVAVPGIGGPFDVGRWDAIGDDLPELDDTPAPPPEAEAPPAPEPAPAEPPPEASEPAPPAGEDHPDEVGGIAGNVVHPGNEHAADDPAGDPADDAYEVEPIDLDGLDDPHHDDGAGDELAGGDDHDV
jgi:hypothetical protein